MATKEVQPVATTLENKKEGLTPAGDVKPSEPTLKIPPRLPAKVEEDKGGYANTGMTADELVEKYGTNPDGSPRTEPQSEAPSCPVVSPSEYPFNTTAIPTGCSAPLSAECVAYYNKLYAPAK